MVKRRLTAILLTFMFILGCKSGANFTHNERDPALINYTEQSLVLEGSNNLRIYSCAASSLYNICRIYGINVTYSECTELLPVSSNGNSMLEVKNTLESIGFDVEAQRITPGEFRDISSPTVALLPVGLPQGKNLGNQLKVKRINSLKMVLMSDTKGSSSEKMMGHYLVLFPLENGRIQIMDYPDSSVEVSMRYWVEYLMRIRAEEVPVLICKN